MAVFTSITTTELAAWLTQFDLGNLQKVEGIASGIENTNYFVTTTSPVNQGEFVLTIFEKLQADELPFYLGFMSALADAGVNVPRPMASRSGTTLHQIKNKPCALATRLEGNSELAPGAEHCFQVGAALAKLHQIGQQYQRDCPQLMLNNPRGLAWWQQVVPTITPYLPAALKALLEEELQAQSDYAQTPTYQALPRGPVHADLFRNNVLFAGSHAQPRLGGFIDFYFAGVDSWLFDLAVTVNDWCIELTSGELVAERYQAMLKAYQQVRALTEPEKLAWPMLLRAAALRFWISRLYDFYLPREAQTLTPHDPVHFERILKLRRDSFSSLSV